MNLGEQKKISLKSFSRKNKIIAIVAIAILVLIAVFFYFRGPVQSIRSVIRSMPKQASCSQLTFYDLAYDVRKTDSIVSKYAGTISGKFGNVNFPGVRPYDFTITLAYQNGRWVPIQSEAWMNGVNFGMENTLFPCIK